jgi:hypothetical protein
VCGFAHQPENYEDEQLRRSTKMSGSDVMDGASVEDIRNLNLFALVESPQWEDARFFGRWLLAAAEAQQAVEVLRQILAFGGDTTDIFL